jgi:hypothetical protein
MAGVLSRTVGGDFQKITKNLEKSVRKYQNTLAF